MRPGPAAAGRPLPFRQPRTAFTYLNLGPTRQKGIELSVDQSVTNRMTAFANYSWPGDPQILDDQNPFPRSELSFPPRHRFNVGGSYADRRWLGSLAVNYTDTAFWTDVLTSPYFGYSKAFTLVNGGIGVKWRNGAVNDGAQEHQPLEQNGAAARVRRSDAALRRRRGPSRVLTLARPRRLSLAKKCPEAERAHADHRSRPRLGHWRRWRRRRKGRLP